MKFTSRLAKNSSVIEIMEKEWAHSQAKTRLITFSCDFTTKVRAEEFARGARRIGLQTAIDKLAACWSVAAWIETSPSPYRISKIEEKLEILVDQDRARIPVFETGEDENDWNCLNELSWIYPEFQVSIDSDVGQLRRDVLFGVRALKPRPTKGILGEKPRVNFDVPPHELLRRARMNAPRRPSATASGFSQWIYSLYNSARGTVKNKADGIEAEEKIWELRNRLFHSYNQNNVQAGGQEWRLAYNGLHLSDEQKLDTLNIDELAVNGVPLRASPDLVYCTADHSQVLIVELKHSQQPIPKNLWPNIWGQLWCYAQTPLAKQSAEVTVIGEVWGTPFGRGSNVRQLRAHVRRNPRARAYDRFFRELFRIYAGET